jgi:hypothetical protein
VNRVVPVPVGVGRTVCPRRCRARAGGILAVSGLGVGGGVVPSVPGPTAAEPVSGWVPSGQPRGRGRPSWGGRPLWGGAIGDDDRDAARRAHLVGSPGALRVRTAVSACSASESARGEGNRGTELAGRNHDAAVGFAQAVMVRYRRPAQDERTTSSPSVSRSDGGGAAGCHRPRAAGLDGDYGRQRVILPVRGLPMGC